MSVIGTNGGSEESVRILGRGSRRSIIGRRVILPGVDVGSDYPRGSRSGHAG